MMKYFILIGTLSSITAFFILLWPNNEQPSAALIEELTTQTTEEPTPLTSPSPEIAEPEPITTPALMPNRTTGTPRPVSVIKKSTPTLQPEPEFTPWSPPAPDPVESIQPTPIPTPTPTPLPVIATIYYYCNTTGNPANITEEDPDRCPAGFYPVIVTQPNVIPPDATVIWKQVPSPWISE